LVAYFEGVMGLAARKRKITLPADLAIGAEVDLGTTGGGLNVREEQLVDLRRRIAATRWPDRETVTDQSQGVQLAKIQELVRYWGTDYDWRKVEAKLNALPQFVTDIDGLDIHNIDLHPVEER
jgi:hypothetical protein